MHARLRELNLHLRLLQPQQNVLLLVRSTSTESLLEDLNRRRLQEDKSRIEIGLLDLLHALIHQTPSDQYQTHFLTCDNHGTCDWKTAYLHLNVQNTRPPLLRHILHRLHAGPVEITPELRMLDEPVLLDELLECLLRHEIVSDAVLLARSRRARGMRDGEAEAIGILVEEAFEEGGLAGARGAGHDDRARLAFHSGCFGDGEAVVVAVG